MDSALIEDTPTYTYRGVLIDTARNFIPVERLRRLVDGMSYNKLNMLHWHITDTQSFPMYSRRVPQVENYFYIFIHILRVYG